MSDEPMMTTADMLEVWSGGGNGAEYVDGLALIDKAVKELREQADRIEALERQIKGDAGTVEAYAALRVTAQELRARIEALERDNMYLKEQCESPFMDGYEMAKLEYRPRLIETENRIEALERERDLWRRNASDNWKRARREALEEAARVAEEKTAGWFDERAYVGQSIAAAIRALIDLPLPQQHGAATKADADQ